LDRLDGTPPAKREAMFRALQVAATGMAAQETKLDTVANNLANANTTGYKKQEVEFEDLLYQNLRAAGPTANGIAPSSTQVGSGARVIATSRAFAQGPILQTGNPLDVAIEGNGFLTVQRPNGDLAYTRSGSLKLDAQGRLVTTDGLPIEPAITVPPDATSVTIAPDGTVSVMQPNNPQPAQVGQLQLATFPNPAGLVSLGHNLYEPNAAAGEPNVGPAARDGRGSFLQNALEGSNVDVVTEMIGLIRTQRAYEINSKVISAADEMLRNATNLR
jgi:flagellar basal-body rod protein FlgG